MTEERVTINVRDVPKGDWIKFRKKCLDRGISASEGIRGLIKREGGE